MTFFLMTQFFSFNSVIRIIWFSIDCATLEVTYQVTIQREMDNKTIQHGSQKLKSNPKKKKNQLLGFMMCKFNFIIF